MRPAQNTPIMPAHSVIDQRSLLLARAVAERIDRIPALLDQARAWAARHNAPALLEWQAILRGTWPEIKATLLRPDQEGQRLRQSSPFVGILTPSERWALYRDTPSA